MCWNLYLFSKFTKLSRLPHIRLFSQGKSGRASPLISTPIFYVNASPHIGHLHSAVVADVIYRTQRLLYNEETVFSTGTDEHGLKIQQAAQKDGRAPQEFCDSISVKFKNLFDLCNVCYTNYIRTTEDTHKSVVQHFWNILWENSHIYKSKYEGWYCTSDEAFLKDKQIIEIKDQHGTYKVSADSKQPVEWMEEDNYLFQLSRFEKDLLHWLSADTVKPAKFADELRHWISEGLPDLSVSRQKSRLHWGIPVPNDESQTIYVWLDALLNYLTASGFPKNGFKWPPTHVIGKDILKFHGIYWPAFLIAANLDPPSKIICHSHWTVDNEKMSKSKGNVVDPFSQIEKVTSDGLRYFLVRDGVPHSDGNFNQEKLRRILNAELANTMGNLLTRSTAPTNNPSQLFPNAILDVFKETCGMEGENLVQEVKDLPAVTAEHFLDGNIYKGLELIMSCLRNTNTFYTNQAPWNLIQSEEHSAALVNVLHVTYETLRVCGILLQPVVPNIAKELLDKLSVGRDERSWQGLDPFSTLCGRTNPVINRRLKEGRCLLFPKLKA